MDFLHLNTTLISLLTVFLGYLLGLWSYYRKKEHEQIMHRYLEQGVDLISANIDHALNVFNENYMRSLSFLKKFRDAEKVGVQIAEEVNLLKFSIYDPRSFSVTPFYKLKSLVGDDVFWDVTQLLFAFVGTTQSFFENDLKFTIQAFYTKGIRTAPAETICDCYLNKVRELYRESEKFYSIVKELQNIALILESEPLTFKKLEKLKKRTEIMKTVQLLRDQFKENINS
jgi:hypothetical protein